jgi:hypothetical protein
MAVPQPQILVSFSASRFSHVIQVDCAWNVEPGPLEANSKNCHFSAFLGKSEEGSEHAVKFSV